MANQYSGVDAVEYSGWRNRSTWNIALWMGNECAYYNEYGEYVYVAAKAGKDIASVNNSWADAKALYRRVYEEAAKADGCIWSNVSWKELREHFDSDVEDAKRYGN
jgi:hypothetical protein